MEELEFKKGTTEKQIKLFELDYKKEMIRRSLNLDQEKFDDLYNSIKSFWKSERGNKQK